MLFSSPEFLFAFLPLFLLIYFAVPRTAKNPVLLIAGIFFYFTTSGELTSILILSILFNYVIALSIADATERKRKILLIFAVVINIVPLLYYKYSSFLFDALQGFLYFIGMNIAIVAPKPPLPIGISFFTFQAVSYILDIYWARVRPARSLIDFGMYHSCFPQLIAGPIVRYEEIEREVYQRIVRLDDLYNGCVQFCFGLAKKVVLADNMGAVANPLFDLSSGSLPPIAAWCGAIAYTLQIYFDFSGYSDMAIGLGRMLGFHFPENFNQPYLSVSITEFWRRWHMTLSRWFRDYVYIPLGGNRRSLLRTLLNLQVVFFLCGLWHGAGYGFVVWGLYHGLLLTVERLAAHSFGNAGRRLQPSWTLPVFGWCYTIVAVMIGWVIFRAATLPQGLLLSPIDVHDAGMGQYKCADTDLNGR